MVALQCVASMAGTLVGEALGSTLSAKLAAGVLGALIGAFLTAPGRHRRRRIVAVAILLALLDSLRRAAGAVASERRREPRAWVPANWAVVGLTAAVGFAGGSAVTTVRGAWADEPSTVAVPEVRGEPRAAALDILAAGGLRAAVTVEPSEEIPEESATRTDPPAGTSVEADGEVALYVSSGPPGATVTVPDVAGDARAAALAVLADAGLEPRVRAEPSQTIVRGSATRTDPPAGTRVARGATVTLLVSSGPATREVEVPDVTGSTLERAFAALEDAGLRPTEQTEASEAVAAGTVIRSDPAAGTLVDEGSAVTVVISSGPPPLVVPDVAGLRSAVAIEQLELAGLGAQRAIVGSATVPDDTVVGTDPPAGTEVERGDTIIVRISCGSDVCVD
jgi:serine/threonine-protein kinase